MFMSYFLEHNRYMNIVGIGVILLIAFIFSKKKRHVDYKLVMNALVLQFIIGLLVLKFPLGREIVRIIADAVTRLYQFADEGAAFVFGSLSNPANPWGVIFAVKVLPIIIFFGALTSVLFYFGIIQKIVAAVNFILRPLLRTTGAESLCAISNSFLGQTEAPLLIRHYLDKMTKSEMLVVMVSGMGTISGSILAVYASFGVSASHMLAASVLAVPGSILIAKILYPETERAQIGADAKVEVCSNAENAFEAISIGTSDGMMLALNVGAMLIAFLALLALINSILLWLSGGANDLLGLMGASFALPAIDLNYIFSRLFAPFGYLLGLTGSDALKAGQLIGTKVSVNEFIAYSEMVKMHLSPRAEALITYALCGFSNFSCIGIQIGGIGALVPSKRKVLSQLGLYAVLGGALTNLLSAMIAGLLI
ncbi:MAG: Nucleoside permease [candidate division TM6 bacterium GW2011_GWF2_32_72]|nr:MAG: Nucleoside permease [candidate division TM6 bacterium GW2011_GWF2_32_72]